MKHAGSARPRVVPPRMVRWRAGQRIRGPHPLSSWSGVIMTMTPVNVIHRGSRAMTKSCRESTKADESLPNRDLSAGERGNRSKTSPIWHSSAGLTIARARKAHRVTAWRGAAQPDHGCGRARERSRPSLSDRRSEHVLSTPRSRCDISRGFATSTTPEPSCRDSW